LEGYDKLFKEVKIFNSLDGDAELRFKQLQIGKMKNNNRGGDLMEGAIMKKRKYRRGRMHT
jgi:hypothetical protein